MNFDFNRLYLTTDGRIGRQDFWIGLIVLAVAGVVVSLIIGALFGWMTTGGQWIVFIVAARICLSGLLPDGQALSGSRQAGDVRRRHHRH
jgi:uncharacterized membrane protein YhaH (DUF805 family)